MITLEAAGLKEPPSQQRTDALGRGPGRERGCGSVRKGRVGQRDWELGLSSPLFPHLHLARSSQQEVVSSLQNRRLGETPGISHPLGCGQHFPAGAVSPHGSSSTLIPVPTWQPPAVVPGPMGMALLLLLGTTCVSLQPQGTEDFLDSLQVALTGLLLFAFPGLPSSV